MSRNDIDAYVVELAQTFSACEAPRNDQRVFTDLGISGSDALEFYDTIEKHFAVDLRPVTEISVDVPRNRFRRAHSKQIARDPSLGEICAFIDDSLRTDVTVPTLR